jgi:ankyrin repeat protein
MDKVHNIIKKLFYFKTPEEKLFDLLENQQQFNFKQFKKLIKRANINEKNVDGNTPLHMSTAVSFILDELLKNGANANMVNKNQNTPLKQNCASLNETDFLKLLEKTSEENLNKIYPDGETILTHLCRKNPTFGFSIINSLVQKKVNLNQPNKLGHTPLFYLATNEQYSTCRNFLKMTQMGARFSKKDLESINLFSNIYTKAFLILGLPENTRLDEKDEKGETLLFKMLKHPIDYTFNNHFPILSDTGNNIKMEIIEKLLSLSNVNETDSNNNFPIQIAIKNQKYPFVLPLIQKGSPVSFVNAKGETLLHWGVHRESGPILSALLKTNKINIDAQDNDGNTPLHTALLKPKDEIAQILLDNNANPLIKNNEGKTVIDFITQNTSPFIMLKIKIRQLEIENERLSAQIISQNRIALPPAADRQYGQ